MVHAADRPGRRRIILLAVLRIMVMERTPQRLVFLPARRVVRLQ
jgi:hypothetical protein